MIFHLAGGTSGIAHFLDQFAGPMEGWWRDLGRPQLTEMVRQQLAEGISAEAAGRSIDEFATGRDRLLVELLALKRGTLKT